MRHRERRFVLRVTREGWYMDFMQLYEEHGDRVRKFILHRVRDEWVADDLVQETFVRVRTKMDAVRDPTKISAWIFGIAGNLCQDHFRSLKRTRPQTHDDPDRVDIPVHLPALKELEQHQMGTCVQNHLKLLPESLRTVLIDSEIWGLSHQEIADKLDLTLENVRVRLHRARTKMKEILQENCGFEKDERNVLVCFPR